jgi:O-antigen/teichoic acid export membrane protein
MELKSLAKKSALFDMAFFTSSTIIFAGSFVVNVLNYVFTLVMSRLMGVVAFGEVAAMLSLLLVISVPSSALTMLMTREVAFRSGQISAARDLFLFLRRHVVIAGIGFWVIFLILMPFLSYFLHISYVPFLIFSLLIPLSAFGALQSGTLQGLQEFFMLSKQNVLSALIKLIVAIILVLDGFSVPGVMVALVLAQISSWIYGYYSTRSTLSISKDTMRPLLDGRGIGISFSAILLATFLLTLLSNIDVLLAKHFLPAVLAGQYGALSTVGKIIIYGIGAFTTVLLPMASAAHARGNGEEKKILALSLSVIALASFCAWALFSIVPTFIVSLLFGVQYLPIAAHLGLFSIAMGCVALVTALINYFVSIHNSSFMYFLALGIVIEVALISYSHDSLGAITAMLVVSSAILLALMSVNYFFWAHKRNIPKETV